MNQQQDVRANDYLDNQNDLNDNINFDEAERKFMHFIQETQERNTYIYR